MTIALAPMTDAERAMLANCEARIERALQRAKREAGAALLRIRDERLYREWCDTFEEYVEQRWNVARSTAYEWLALAGVEIACEQHPVIIAGESRVIEPPKRIAHAVILSKLPATRQAEALHEARQIATQRGASEPTIYEVKRVVFAKLDIAPPVSPAQAAHERQQRAVMDHIRRMWAQLDTESRRRLAAELQTWE
jgi:hypothetical protein